MEVATAICTEPCVIVYVNFGPYHVARLSALSAVMPNIIGVEISRQQRLYPWRPVRECLGFECRTLFAERPFESIPDREQCKAVREVLSEIAPAVVIVAGYREPVMRAVADWARKRGIPSILLFVSTYFDHPRKWWKELLKRKLVSRYSAVAASGQRAFDYARRLGMSKSHIFQIGNVVDNEHFLNRSLAILKDESKERRRRSLPEQYFLSVSRLSAEKNYPALLEAFQSYRKQGGKWDLVIVGGGSQEQGLLEITKAHSICGVHLVGWQCYEELPAYYALARCFILPSLSEPWGLVVNEAMACGLGVLVSRRCGCLPELCYNGVNGYDFDHCDKVETVRLMLRMSSGEEDLQAMGKNSRQIISAFTPKSWARSLKDGINTTLQNKR